MHKTYRFFVHLIVSLLFFSKFALAELPGVTPGSFTVSDSGAANYTLPVSTPAGVAGMSPDLALTYSSKGGNGLMGVGFQLNGFSSSIHRCGGSHATDGRASGVTYTNADKLCFNGQRLILSKGTRWVEGAEYRTEIDSFTKVVYLNGKFLVYSKDGLRTWYQWKVTASNKIVRWLKSSEHDRSGNIVRYYYQHINGEHWIPKEVLWTGKGSKLGNRKAKFSYRELERPDKRFIYDYGVKRQQKHLIEKITTYIGTSKIKEYKFSYAKSPVSGLSRLRYVWQCGSTGGCFPKHEFQWKDTQRGFSGDTAAYHLPVKVYNYRDQREIEEQSGDFIDVNNDGLVDYVVSYKDNDNQQAHHAIYKNTGSRFQLISQKPPTSFVMRDYRIRKKNLQQGIFTDVNSDGYPDIVRSYSVVYITGHREQKKEVWINNRNWTWSKSSSFVPPTVLWTYSAGWGSNRNTSIDTDQFDFRDPYLYTPLNKASLTDINGDGLVDWVVSYKNFKGTKRRGVWLNNGSQWVRTSSYDLPSTMLIDDYWELNSQATSSFSITSMVDVNGDGLQDLVKAVRYKSGVHETQYDAKDTWLNTGSGWKHSPQYKLPDFMLDYTRVRAENGSSRDFMSQSRGGFVDVNGDGLVDWVRSYKDNISNTNHRYTWLNTGNGWTANTAYNLPGSVMNDYSNATGNRGGHPSGSFFDVNRDGLVDWVVAHKNLAGTTVRNTYLNSGVGWKPADASYKFPNILIDNNSGWKKRSVQFGGLMDLNGDGAIDYLMSINNYQNQAVEKVYLGKAKPADMVNKIIDTMGSETGIVYKPMNDRSVYSDLLAESDYTLRKLKVSGPMPLVSDSWQSNGVGGRYWLKYHYYQALSDSKRGYSGFSQRRIWDKQQKFQSIKDFYQEFPATGVSKRELVYKVDNITSIGQLGDNHELLNYKINFIKRVSDLAVQGSVLNYDRITHNSGKYTYAPRIRRSRTSEYELGQKHFRSSWTNTVYDSYQNAIQITTATLLPYRNYEDIDWSNTFWKRATTQYSNNTASWLIGLPTRVSVDHHAPGKPNQVRVSKSIYNSLGQQKWHVIEPDKANFTVTTRNDFDGFGNQIGKLVFGNDIANRYSSATYSEDGMHKTSTTNAEGHVVQVEPDSKCDAPKTTTDANELVTQIKYDQFCRQIRVDRPDGTWSLTYYPNSVDNRILERTKNQPDVTTYFDNLGRDIRVESKGFDGRTIITEKRYNFKGQISQESQPFYDGGAKYWIKYYYDALGRLDRTITPDNSFSSIDYDGLTTITSNPKGQTHTQIKDIVGQLKTVLDDQGNALNYSYDAVGNLLSTFDPAGNKVTLGHDHLGRKIWMDDPNMGRWKYEYDVLGQLIKQTDAKGQNIRTKYDRLGRMIERHTGEGVSTWEYDTADNGIGKLAVTQDAGNYSRIHFYDALSRPSWTHEKVKNVLTKSLNTYNSNGKLNSVYYPGRKNSIAYAYNSLGYLNRIYDYDHNGGNPIREDLWVVQEMDAKGNVTEEYYGNGVNVSRNHHPTRNYLRRIVGRLGTTSIQNLSYTMDAIGNLTARKDHTTGTEELFKYDNLNRLIENRNTLGTFSLDPVKVFSYEYDVLGNMTYRSDLGTLNYAERGFGPHAVTSVQRRDATMTEDIFNPYGWYSYDANGNLIKNKDRKISWTSFNKPKVMETLVNSDPRKMVYDYGTEFQRITKFDANKNKTIRYFGQGSLEHIKEQGETHWKYYIPVGSTTLEIKYKQSGSNSAPVLNQVEKQYLFKDHVGSTDVIVDDGGNIVERLSFNPWGERRNADWTEADIEIVSGSNRGFTGHEMDDEIGLVNMKARIYDPVLGRFLSPDALIPNPTDLQSYNRYSYVRNNPLSFSDPSGFERVRLPGTGSYYADTETGKLYQKTTTIKHGCEPSCGKGDRWGSGTTVTSSYKEVTDSGLKSHLVQRIGVASEILKNHDRLTRGNTKAARNQALSDARSIAGCANCNAKFLHDLRMQGRQSAEFNAAMDRYAAASDLYVQAQRQNRRARLKLVVTRVWQAVGAYIGAPDWFVNVGTGAINGGSTKDIVKGVGSGIVSGSNLPNPVKIVGVGLINDTSTKDIVKMVVIDHVGTRIQDNVSEHNCIVQEKCDDFGNSIVTDPGDPTQRHDFKCNGQVECDNVRQWGRYVFTTVSGGIATRSIQAMQWFMDAVDFAFPKPVSESKPKPRRSY